jgi:hypothetical protein
VGEKVTVHYYITGRGKVYAKRLKRPGRPSKARKKR